MSHQFDFDPTNRVLRCRFDGHVTDEALKEFSRMAVEQFIQIDPCCGVIDFSEVTSEVSFQTVSELACYGPVLPNPRCVYVVVAPSDPMFELARLYQFEGQSACPNLHVVRTLREAWAILGVLDPQFQQLQAV
jgi:hypothetical protein